MTLVLSSSVCMLMYVHRAVCARHSLPLDWGLGRANPALSAISWARRSITQKFVVGYQQNVCHTKRVGLDTAVVKCLLVQIWCVGPAVVSIKMYDGERCYPDAT